MTPPMPHIDPVAVAHGHIGLTACPGRDGALAVDLDAIRDWGAQVVVTLIPDGDGEGDGAAVVALGDGVRARGMDWVHVPIRDYGVPDAASLALWRAASPRLHLVLERGGRVVIHCRAGLGRTGTMAALLLIERGLAPDAAIAAIRAARPGAVETAVQEDWLAAQGMPGAHRLQACLLGGAIGDSLGAEIEFLSLAAIRARFPGGLTDLPPHDGLRGAITDDTQMTLFTAEGLIRARVRGLLKGIAHPPSVVHHALLRWYRTQGGAPQMPTDDMGLIADLRLFARRAPGLTCLSALGDARRFGAAARNDSKGCGTIMRVAPVALMARRGQVRDLAIATSALTHGHITGQLAAGAWAEMLADVAQGMTPAAAEAAMAAYGRIDGGAETVAALRAAVAAPRDGRPETVEGLGGGWTAETALSIALYACLAGRDTDHALRIAVTHGGDSDSTGAIAGNMLGVMDPDAVLAHRWATTIECADVITRLGRDWTRLDTNHTLAEAMSAEYPGA